MSTTVMLMGRDVPRTGRWLWRGTPPTWHRYHDDGTSWCGDGPKVDHFETKTPGQPWCRRCVEMSSEVTS